MQEKLKVGDRVKVIGVQDLARELVGKIGEVFDFDLGEPCVDFGTSYGEWNGWSTGTRTHCWMFEPGKLALVSDTVPTIASDLKLTPQARTILEHLKRRQHISPAEADRVYGITRLASCIHEIRRKAGYPVKTTVKRDDVGHKYANYALLAA